MTTTTGLVQRLAILNTGFACAFIGPNPTNVEALVISRVAGETASDLTWKNSMVGGLVAAIVTRQQVWVTHGDNDAEISAVMLGGPFFL